MNLQFYVARLKGLDPMRQSLLMGAVVFVIYEIYLWLARGVDPMTATLQSVIAAALFSSVYYLTTVLLNPKGRPTAKKGKGRRKA